MARSINSIPALGNPVTPKQVISALKAPLAAIPNDTSGNANEATVNAILAALRTLGFIAP
jgi:hypothetical protein